MLIQYIHEFVVLSDRGNYMAAAEDLYISQSSLSKHIMALEKELDCPLFSRSTRKVHLTQFGRVFLPYARQIVEADTQFRQSLEIAKKDANDFVRLGVLPSFLAYGVDNVIVEFQKRMPGNPVFITEGSNEELLSNLRNGSCNLALVRSFANSLSPEFEAVPILDEELAVAIAPGSVLDDGREHVSLSELSRLDLLSSTSKTMDDLVNSLEVQYQVHLNIVSKFSRAPGILGVLRKGIGDGALLHRLSARYYQKQNPEDIRILEIEEPISTTVSLVYLKGRPLTRPLSSFINLTVSQLATGKYQNERSEE